MQIHEIYKVYLQHPIVTTDSRNPSQNSIFIALKGAKFNGNHFALDALNAGCSYAIVDELPEFVDYRIILVDNCLETLQELANYHRCQLGLPVIAITGSNGKTTTKELISRVLERKFKIIATSGNLNNHIGVPLTLLSLKKDTELAVVEMGANHIGEIKELCEIAEPDFGVITNIGKAHLEGFGSPAGVVKAKNELYNHLINADGTVFVNWNNPILKNLLIDFKVRLYKYGASDDCDCMGGIESTAGPLTFGFYHAETNKKYSVSTNLFGSYNFENALCAVAVGMFFKVPPIDIIDALELYEPKNNRSQLIKTLHNQIVMDAYNANPSSLRAAIEEFSKQEIADKVFILGDMFEMGDYSEMEHEAILTLLDSLTGIECILVGIEFIKTAKGRYLSFPNVESLIAHLQVNPFKQKNILIKGSRGVQLEKCLDFL